MSDEQIGGGKKNPTPAYNNAVRARGDQFQNALTAYGHTGPAVATQLGGPMTTTDGASQIALNQIKAKSMLANLANRLAEEQSGAGRRLAEINAAIQGDRSQAEYNNNAKYLKAQEEIDNYEPWYEKLGGVMSTAIGLGRGLRAISNINDPNANSYDVKKYNAKMDELKSVYNREPTADELDKMHNVALQASLPKQGVIGGLAGKAAGAFESVIPGLKKLHTANIANAQSARAVQEFNMSPGDAKRVKDAWMGFLDRQTDAYGEGFYPDDNARAMFDEIYSMIMPMIAASYSRGSGPISALTRGYGGQ